MAYTKIKAIRVRLDRCVDYALNPEKTSLDDAIDYIENEDKTAQQFYVSAYNCNADTAFADMQDTKRRWSKAARKKAVLGYHVIQSFAPGEVTPEQAHSYGRELAERLFAGRYEVVVTTHLDQKHLHNHIVFNAVSFVDGKMYRNNFKDYFGDIRGTSDRICYENSLSIITPKHKGRNYSEWLADKAGKPTIRSMVQKDIDEIIAASFTFKTFLEQLQKYGYEVKYGDKVQYIAVRPEGEKRFIRLKSLGENYTEEAIKRRLAQVRNGETVAAADRQLYHKPKRYRVKQPSAPYKKRKLKGFVALYFHYLYLLGKVKRRTLPNRAAFLLREDILQFDRYVEQFRFLAGHEITCLAELTAYAGAKRDELQIHKSHRNELYKERRNAPDEETRAVVSAQIAQKNAVMRLCRKELALCNRIEADNQRISEAVQAARQETRNERIKEEKQYEHRSRRSRYDGA